MSLSDDDDDDFFNGPGAIQALQAAEHYAASQTAKPTDSQPKYHHTVSTPKVRPLNTEPRVSSGGFGWGDGGKHFGAAQMERIIAASRQQAYREEDPPEVTVGTSGAYVTRIGPSEAITRATTQTSPEKPQNHKIDQTLRETVAGPSHKTPNLGSELQAELWKAKGEVETMRRTQKQELARYSKEAERLKRQVADMEQKLRDKEKETARQLESLKTQAVFNNHAVYNSATRRQAIPESSPKRKGKERSFRGLVNAFETSDAKTSVPLPLRPLPEVETYAGDADSAEFIHDIFGHTGSSLETTLFRIVTAKESPDFKVTCEELLRACGETATSLTVTSEAIMDLLVTALCHSEAVETRTAILELLTGMLWLHPHCALALETSGIGTWCREVLLKDADKLGSAIGELCVSLCLCGSGNTWHGRQLVDIILSDPQKEVDIFVAACQNPSHFRQLVGPSEAYPEQGPQPVLDRMSRLLLKPHSSSKRITDSFALLSRADVDGPLLVGEKTCLIPAVVIYLNRISSAVWGISDLSPPPIDEILSALSLLHGLIHPAPHAAVEPNGVNLGARLYAAAQTREFSGVHHIFQAAIGRMAYIPIDGASKTLSTIQDLCQDLIDITLEGPEGDAVYSLYSSEVTADDDDQEMYAEMEM